MSVFYCCLALCVMMGVTIGSGSNLFFMEFDVDLSALQQAMENEGDLKLYCPDSYYVKTCQREAMECFREELNVLDFEYDGTLKQNVSDIIVRLKRAFDFHLSHLNVSKSCQRCEHFEEKPVTDFLNGLKTLMQFHNKRLLTSPQ
ncbi:interleukin-15-like [Chiloscyllium punctatum]|uniref:interleukin-15-like n=1 Tax=Chiloscyllium punctatum TaxID=137246 RepID=UPI003B63323D